MTKAGHSALMIAVVIVSAVAAVSLGGTAVALNPDTAAPYPHSPGVTVQEFPVSVIVERNDAIARNGLKTLTLDFGADSSFDGSVKNVSTDDIDVTIAGRNDRRTLGAFEVVRSRSGTIKIRFNRAIPVNPGDRIVVEVANMTTPSAEGNYVVAVSASTPSGKTDGPVSVSYRVEAASLTFENQSASQFSASQTVTLSGVVPNAGYIAVFTVAENGSRGRLVGSTEPIIARYTPRNYTVDLNGNVKESQRLVAVVYYETSGESQDARLNASFDPDEDAVVTNNGEPAAATAFIETLDADGQVMAGRQYPQGAQLYFDQGEPNTAYQIRAVENGSPGAVIDVFETGANGSAVIDTAELAEGQYTITRLADGSVVSLDDDSTTGARDDSFFITETTGQMNATTTTTTNDIATTTTNGTATTTTNDIATTTTNGTATTTTNGSAGGDGGDAGGDGSGGADESGDGAGGNGGDAGGNGGGDSGVSDVFGPGFGPVVAVIALLAVALLARRTR